MRTRGKTVLLAFLLVLASTFFCILIAASAEEPAAGDVNGDGTVSSLDYQLLKHIFFGKSVSADVQRRADVNNDGVVTSADYMLVKRIFSGVPVQIPPERLPEQPVPEDSGQPFSFRVQTSFSDNMVLQRNRYIEVYGTGDRTGGIVYVNFSGETRYAVVDENGAWSVFLNPQRASAAPAEMKVYTKAQGPGGGILFKNILVGDVWIIAGQSNAQLVLEKTLAANPDFKDTINKKDAIRLFTQNVWDCKEYWVGGGIDETGRFVAKDSLPETEVGTGRTWQKNTYVNARNFSAVGYYFAKKVADHTDVPIGIIQVVAGGSVISEFMPPDQYRPELHNTGFGDFAPCDLYNCLMAPFSRTAITGMLWYQGESNMYDYAVYAENLRDYVAMMRNIFGQKMEFYCVQLTSHSAGWPYLADMRYAQEEAGKLIDNYYLVCSMDYGSREGDIDGAHPAAKKHIGDRLAYLALSRIYNYKEFPMKDYGSPSLIKAVRKDDYVYLYFNNIGNGLETSGSSQLVRGFSDYNTGQALPARIQGKNCVSVYIGEAAERTIAYGNSPMADYTDCTLRNSNQIGAVAFKYTVK